MDQLRLTSFFFYVLKSSIHPSNPFNANWLGVCVGDKVVLLSLFHVDKQGQHDDDGCLKRVALQSPCLSDYHHSSSKRRRPSL